VTTKFVRVNKGDDENPDVRCRLCARDFKVKGEELRSDLFAAMPPLEAKKMLFRQAARGKSRWRSRGWGKPKLLFIDVKKAHLNGMVPEEVFAYVKMPDGKCWRLKRWLYGMRPAASAWEVEYTEKMATAGYAKGKSAPTVFFNAKTGGRCVVHGDDFTFLADEAEVKRMTELMRRWYDIKVRGILGGEPGDDEELTILNRRISWRNGVIEYEADSKHAETIVKEMGLDKNSKGLDAPIERESSEDAAEDESDEMLEGEEATRYRALAATANFLAMDRPDVQYTAKEICKSMSKPKRKSWAKLKRLARYLVKYPRLVWRFLDDGNVGMEYLDVYSDSDWAGDKVTRKSTSGGVAALAGGALKTWSSTQGTIAMSSGEAEYYAMVKAAAEGLGIQALAEDLGFQVKLRLWVDSTAAKAIISRIGLGKVRHMEVKYLWAQEAHKNGRFEVYKVPGELNPADVNTKPESATEMDGKLRSIGAHLVRRAIEEPWDRIAQLATKKEKWADIQDDEE
jgi:hypothetical protein